MSNLLVQNIKHTNGTTAQTIDSSGRVLTPARPAFSAKKVNSGGGASLNGHITFDTVTFNVGSGWDGTNKFQAPIAGIYSFSLNAFTTNNSAGVMPDGGELKMYLEQDTDSSFGSPTVFGITYTYLSGTAGFFNVSMSGLASLAANEYVRVNVASGYIYTSTVASNLPPIFSGYLVG
jgi:hypothetical protein